jgi:hypothetical protein
MTFLPLLLALGLCAGIVRGQSGTETESHVNESIARLVRDLGSDDYESRVAATERLEQFGRAAVDPVTQAAKDGELEVAIRAIAVLQHLAIAEDEPTADAATRALETLHRLNNRSLSWRAGHALNFVRHWAELAIESIGGRVSTERGENGELVAQIKLEGLSGGKLAPLQRRALKKFQVLVVAGGKVTDAEVEFLADLETLAHLDVRYTQIGDKTLTRLRPGLKKLLLSGTRVSDAGLADVRRLKELRVLYLSGNEITDAGIAHVATLPQLEELNLSQCKAVTDEGAARLARVESLKHLNLTGTQVGDEGLRRLAEVAGLEGLYLHGTRVTDEGVAQFRAARPNCRVRH